MKDEALKLALEAAEIGLANLTSYQSAPRGPTNHEYGQAVRALIKVREAKASLAQPAQDWKIMPKKDAPLVEWANEQTPPKRPWVGLTDGEVSEAYKAAWKKAEFGMGIERKDVYEAIEAKLKEKNNG